jgi:ribonuclease P/MRP protein subunit RPP1
LTTHIISLLLTCLPFRIAIKIGTVFEIAYAGTFGGDDDISSGDGESGAGAKRNWWAAARELVRVMKRKGLIVSRSVGLESSVGY